MKLIIQKQEFDIHSIEFTNLDKTLFVQNKMGEFKLTQPSLTFVVRFKKHNDATIKYFNDYLNGNDKRKITLHENGLRLSAKDVACMELGPKVFGDLYVSFTADISTIYWLKKLKTFTKQYTKYVRNSRHHIATQRP